MPIPKVDTTYTLYQQDITNEFVEALAPSRRSSALKLEVAPRLIVCLPWRYVFFQVTTITMKSDNMLDRLWTRLSVRRTVFSQFVTLRKKKEKIEPLTAGSAVGHLAQT